MNKIRKGDNVIVIAGKDKGKRGVVLERVSVTAMLVEGINRVKKHTKPNPAKGQAGGIIEKEMPINASNLALFNVLSKSSGWKMVETFVSTNPMAKRWQHKD